MKFLSRLPALLKTHFFFQLPISAAAAPESAAFAKLARPLEGAAALAGVRSPSRLAIVALATALSFGAATGATAAAQPAPSGDYVESFDTLYNSLTVERKGSVVELRARSRAGEYLESAVDLDDPLKLVVAYTRSLYAGLFFQPKPTKVLMIGLGGAGFHRLFAKAYPDALLQTVELDPKVLELTRTRLAFAPTDRTPVATMDGRLFVKRSTEKWDWLILDAFRGGFVPPHLKTQEFYRECAAHLAEGGVFITNLHATTELYYSDLKTLRTVFPQVVLFQTAGRGNVIACAVKQTSPNVTDPATWTPVAQLNPPLQGYLDMAEIRAEHIDWPTADVASGRVLTDDFAPVEFLDAMKTNNTKK